MARRAATCRTTGDARLQRAASYSGTGTFPCVAGGLPRTPDARVGRPLAALRIVLLVEAISYLVLLGIAMPLKYWYGKPMAVRVSGMIHGVLFLLMIWLLLRAYFEAKWSRRRVWLVVAASIVPLWPFAMDRRVKQWVHDSAPPAGGAA